MHTNLFSEAFQRRMLLKRRSRQWIKVWAIAGAAAAVVALARWPETRVARAELEAAERRSAPVAEVLAQCEQLKADLIRIADARMKLQSLTPDSVPLGVLGLISSAARAANDDVQIRSINYTAVKHLLQPTKDSASSARGSIVVHGLAANEAAAAQFVEHLRRSPALEHVELKASSRATTSVPAIQFDVVCHL